MEHCNKEKEVNEIANDVAKLKQTVNGNGRKGLFSITQTLAENMAEVKADVKCLVLFQAQVETRQTTEVEHKEEVDELKRQHRKTQMWLIGLAATVTLALLSQILI